MSETGPTNQDIWETEWVKGQGDESLLVPGHASTVPSSSIQNFLDYMVKNGWNDIASYSGIDIGCGIGRNTFPLAIVCKSMRGIDYASSAITACKRTTLSIKLGNVIFSQEDILTNFVDEDLAESFDFALDSLTSASIYKAENRYKMADNIYKLLKPGGVAWVRAVSTMDEMESQLMLSNPGPETGSSVWPGSGKFQKNFTVSELVDMYGRFDPVIIRREKKQARKLGKDFTATNWWAIFEKTA